MEGLSSMSSPLTVMSTSNYYTPPRSGTYTPGRNLDYERPMPLRILKYGRNNKKETPHTMDRARSGIARHRQAIQGEGTLAVAKRRKVDPGRISTDKENLGMPQRIQTLEVQDNPGIYEAECWVQHDTLPTFMGVTPSPQLSVKRTKQKYAQARMELEQHDLSPPSSASTLPIGYGMRRPVNARPPLTNIYDRATLFEEEIRPMLHIACQEETVSRSNERPLLPPSVGVSAARPLGQGCSLTPHVGIIPEVNTLEKGCHTLWVAIEISIAPWATHEKKVQLQSLRKQPSLLTDSARLACCEQEMEESFEAGGIFDLNIEVLPMKDSSVARILQEQAFPIKHLGPGSGILLLAQVQIHVEKGMQKEMQPCSPYESDHLIQALEAELGDLTCTQQD
ncbi:hypothetical protein FHETE_6341 [Fusarium heterosporum]|uniref:Uncharacterized protein n=1 Tax=Fusarium heterosporum TaxID=42747 RepID=A0A8H5T5T7_FUSHE|nr:hypothetical protein FHETE_6341 [Fusarium heterosporum]